MRKELGASKVGSAEYDFTARLETGTRDHLIGRRDMLWGCGPGNSSWLISIAAAAVVTSRETPSSAEALTVSPRPMG